MLTYPKFNLCLANFAMKLMQVQKKSVTVRIKVKEVRKKEWMKVSVDLNGF